VDHSLIAQRFLGEEGLKGTGLYLGKIFAPFGFFQELIFTATERLGEAPEDLIVDESTSKDLDGLAYSARLRNYWDLSEASNLEVSGSFLTGKKERELSAPVLYKSFILQGEFMAQQNEDFNLASSPAPVGLGDFSGLYVFGRYQISRRGYLGARFDALDDPEFGGERTTAYSAYYQFFPSEFSKILGKFERVSPKGFESFNRFLIQATFALGPHKPHPF
jgi:hypothetical protein